MNKRQQNKQLKNIKVSLYDACQQPRTSAKKTTGILASIYRSTDDPLTKMIVELEVQRLQDLFKEG